MCACTVNRKRPFASLCSCRRSGPHASPIRATRPVAEGSPRAQAATPRREERPPRRRQQAAKAARRRPARADSLPGGVQRDTRGRPGRRSVLKKGRDRVFAAHSGERKEHGEQAQATHASRRSPSEASLDGVLRRPEHAGGGGGATSRHQDLAEEHRHGAARRVMKTDDGGGRRCFRLPPPSTRSAALR